ncbi:BrnT family toxin [Oleiphilus sp. HI0079]|nr:BrnT family toxin [Oleiphilus sp. HI0079]
MAKPDDEPRALNVGMIGQKHCSAIITYRSDNIRIMSVRRPRDSGGTI